MSETFGVYAAINAVQAALSKNGIAKDRKADTGGAKYNFRGIDDTYNALSGLLAEHKLCIIPRVVSRNCVERVSASNKALFYVTVEAEFDLVALDGSRHTARSIGEAMDSSDKATNKAMSAAYKYMCFQLFCIPTVAEDSETAHHEVQPRGTVDAAQKVAVKKLEVLKAKEPQDPPEIAEHLAFIRDRTAGAAEALGKYIHAELIKCDPEGGDIFYREARDQFIADHSSPRRQYTPQENVNFACMLWNKVDELRLLKASADSTGDGA